MPRRKKTELPKSELNITSMMDLVLNLLMFFVLTSNFAMAELPSLEPPTFLNSKARAVDRSNQVTVSILPDKVGNTATGSASKVKVGSFEMLPTEMAALSDHLAKEKAKDENVTIELRADKALTYDQVQPVMKAIRDAGIKKFNVIAEKEQSPSKE